MCAHVFLIREIFVGKSGKFGQIGEIRGNSAKSGKFGEIRPNRANRPNLDNFGVPAGISGKTEGKSPISVVSGKFRRIRAKTGNLVGRRGFVREIRINRPNSALGGSAGISAETEGVSRPGGPGRVERIFHPTWCFTWFSPVRGAETQARPDQVEMETVLSPFLRGSLPDSAREAQVRSTSLSEFLSESLSSGRFDLQDFLLKVSVAI
jgi:hypothetical protein